MVNESPEPISRLSFDAQELVTKFPPRLQNANKRIVFGIACPNGCSHRGEVVFSRWRKIDLPWTLDSGHPKTVVDVRDDYFGYEPAVDSSPDVEWYLNFAHFDLFGFYGGPLFAQDEMQVAEHPALGSLREGLLRLGVEPLTVENGQPTPVLVRGVERRCRVATNPDAGQGRPRGLYGNNFAAAAAEVVARATTPIAPPTTTNILAMEAPDGGCGAYGQSEIEYVLSTAYSGFAAAKVESTQVRERPRIVIHSGFWGCGAYGGNRVLMALLQLLAARLAEIDRLVFHTGDASGSAAFTQARALMERDLARQGAPLDVSALLEAIHGMKLEWGVSDGN